MKIAVLTDSSAYLTKEQQEQYHIDVVPIPLIWGDKPTMTWSTSAMKIFTKNRDRN